MFDAGHEGEYDVHDLLLLLHALATFMMFGVILFVQLVHYPLLASIPASGFAEYAGLHQRWTTWVVGPPMLAEVALTCWIIKDYANFAARVDLFSVVAAFVLLLVIWGSTAVFSIPMHARLARGRDDAAIRFLARTNWIRTIAWGGRAAIAASWCL